MVSRGPRPVPEQLHVHSLDDLLGRLKPLINSGWERPSLMLIGGCSRAGKSTLAHALASRFTAGDIAVCVLGLDHWLIGIDKRAPDSTVLQRYDCEAITTAISSLLRGETVHPPVYDVVTRRRVAERSDANVRVETGVVILEGVIALGIPDLLTLAQARIFTDVADDVRLARLRQFYTGTKGLSDDEAIAVIAEREVEEVPFIKATKANAEFLFKSG